MKLLIRALIALAALAVVTVAVPVALVLLNRMPASLAKSVPFVKTYVVEGDVRMTDGETRPDDTVQVTVTTSRGKKVSTKATEKNGYHYTATFMGFSEPLRAGDTVHITATTPLSESMTELTQAAELKTVLIADFDRKLAEKSTGNDGTGDEVLRDRVVKLWSGTPPDSVDGWKETPLAAMQNFPELRIDATANIIAEFQPMSAPTDDIPFKVELPDVATLDELNRFPLGNMGAELARQPFEWDKRSSQIPFRYRLSQPSFVTVRIVTESGVEIRSQKLGVPTNVGRDGGEETWNWDGRNNGGQFADIGNYTFIALADSLSLGDGTKGFIAEIAGEGGSRVRYAEFASTHTVGDFLDAYGLTVEERAAKVGRSRYQLRETVSLFRADPNGASQRISRTFNGTDTLASFLTEYALDLDPVTRAVRQLGVYNLVARGVEKISARVEFEQLRSTVTVGSREEFMALPLSQLEVMDGGVWTPLAPLLPLRIRIVLPPPPEASLEDWQRAAASTTTFSPGSQNTLTDVIARLEQEPGVTATVRGSVEDVRQFDARIAAPNGAKVKFYLGQADEPGHMTANIRAAGLVAKLGTDGVTLPIEANGQNRVPVEVTLIGLDGKTISTDTLTASASEGEVSDRGRMRLNGNLYRAIYTVPLSPDPTTVKIQVSSKQLNDRHRAKSADGEAVLFRASLDIDLIPTDGQLAETTDPATGAPVNPVQTPPTSTTPTSTQNQNVASQPTAQQTPPATNGATATTPDADAAAESKKIAKVFAKMPPATVAPLILAMSPEQAKAVLLNMPDRAAALIVDAVLSAEAEGADDPAVMQQRKQSILAIFSN
ncbi:MAG: hypothetical protein O3A46_01325 [Candidatus Poribacteria bacterium]|nr:hypothetical protein [Candidatus Poribacteria bacterium]